MIPTMSFVADFVGIVGILGIFGIFFRSSIRMVPVKPAQNLPALRKRVAKAPTDPGIYRWMDAEGKVMYVGKAKNLRKRLQNYVMPGKGGHGPWRQSFLQKIADFDVTVCGSEFEALMLETNLIKQLKPKYNVLMKDDKNYLFIRVTAHEWYPRVDTVRRLWKDGSKYFGPYMNSDSARNTLALANASFGYLACEPSLEFLNKKRTGEVTNPKPCLEYQIGLCCGLCINAIPHDEYLRRISELMKFLKGNKEGARKILEAKMQTAAAEKRFEAAARFRNFLRSLDDKKETQLVTDASGDDTDAIGIAVLSERVHVVVLHQRNGRVIGETHHRLSGQADSIPDVLDQILPQLYDEGTDIPSIVLLPDSLSDAEAMQKLLAHRRGASMELLVPERGNKSKLVDLATMNAEQKARQMEMKWESEERNRTDALTALQELLKLPSAPRRIEGYDISHLGGTETVGSMVVLKDGKTANDQYRSFAIRTIREGDIDDYRSMKEVLRRRLRRLTGGLKNEEEQLAKTGVVLRKAKKADQEELTKIRDGLELVTDALAYKETMVAVAGEEIVAMARLNMAAKTTPELQSVWVEPKRRGDRIGQILVRKILKGVKKGKVYLIAEEDLEQYYAELGFRHVIKPPAAIENRLNILRDQQPETFPVVVLLWEAIQNKIDPSLSTRPDLLVIDGGKGQLGVVVEALQEAGIEIPVIGLAKREEEIFVPGDPNPIPFPKDSPAKFLLMRLRDEAHRFANKIREGRGLKAMKRSALDDLLGIGDVARTELMKKFGDIESLGTATDEELLEVLNKNQVAMIKKFFGR